MKIVTKTVWLEYVEETANWYSQCDTFERYGDKPGEIRVIRSQATEHDDGPDIIAKVAACWGVPVERVFINESGGAL